MKILLLFTALIALPVSLSHALNFEVIGENSRACNDWCSSNLESPTGVNCVGAKLQVAQGWVDITCGGGPAVSGAVKCSCQ